MAIRARKRFGQHFLHDRNIIQNIVDHVDLRPGQTLVEIGPGTGALTIPLLSRTPSLHVIEIDTDLAQLLETRIADNNKLIIHREDVLKFDFCSRISGRLFIIGNLPYNISTPLLFHLLNQSACIEQMIFMLQKEVAERICAAPGSRDYGRLSIMIQSVCRVEWLLNVSASSFSPPPKVESAVIKLCPLTHTGNTIANRKLFNDVVRSAFSKRRKTIRNALKSLASEQNLLDADITPSARPEEIAVEIYIKLANLLAVRGNNAL